MESDLLALIRLAEEHPGIAKEHVLDELRSVTAQRLWPRLTEAQRGYACGLLHGPLPAKLEWGSMPAQARTILATGVLRWAKACMPATPSSPSPGAATMQTEPGTAPVGC
jgi:hypothetical protein